VAEVRVREARPDERAAVMNVLDGAMLDVPLGRVTSDGTTTLVACVDDRVLGALVLDGDRVTAVAVRRARRDQGIGTALVEAAADRRERLVAAFDADVRPFWESLGFAVEPAEEPNRYRGVLHVGSE
jgi:GNAT superfamily N-acetyltransferase